MKICVLNGSPKNEEYSVTRYYVRHIMNGFPDIEFKNHNITQDINKIIKDLDFYNNIISDIMNSDFIIWAFPVYTFHVPSQIIKFIEIVEHNKDNEKFYDKFTTVLTTSIRCYDNFAHDYIKYITNGWNMKYIHGYSAEMNDIMDETERDNLIKLFRNMVSKVENNEYYHIPINEVEYGRNPYKGMKKSKEKSEDNKIVIISDKFEDDICTINSMIETLVNESSSQVSVIRLTDINDGNIWCNGCVKCMFDGVCVQDDNFGMIVNEIKSCDILVIATETYKGSFSSTLKGFFDRLIVEGHGPFLIDNRPSLGIMISGHISTYTKFIDIITGYFMFKGARTVKSLSDYVEQDDLTLKIGMFIRELERYKNEDMYDSSTYLDKSVSLILREFVYEWRGVLPIDDKFYNKHELFDFPNEGKKQKIKNKMLSSMMKIPAFKRWVRDSSEKIIAKDMERVVE